MTDLFKNHQTSLESPASRLAMVTPDDAQDLPFATRAIAAETAGHIQVRMISGDTGRIYLPAGVPFPLRVDRILATGTTATGLVALA